MLLVVLGVVYTSTAESSHNAVVANATASMWQELNEHCTAGKCTLHSGSKRKMDGIANTTDCKGRLLAYEYGLLKIPARAPQLESFDALELSVTCGVTRPKEIHRRHYNTSAYTIGYDGDGGDTAAVFYVAAEGGDDEGLGLADAPFATIHQALEATRRASSPAAASTPKAIVLQAGVHYLNATIKLGAADSGLTITAAKGAEGRVTVSGGVLLRPKWSKSTRPSE